MRVHKLKEGLRKRVQVFENRDTYKNNINVPYTYAYPSRNKKVILLMNPTRILELSSKTAKKDSIN